MAWRLIACRPNGDGSEDLITTDIPISAGNSVTLSLSAPTAMTVSLPIYFSAMKAGDGNPVIIPWGTTIYAERNGVIMGGGIVDEMSEEAGKLEISVIGFVGYLNDMPYTEEYTGYKVDPLDLARLIWTHVQKKPGGNLGLVVSGLRTNRRIGVKGVAAFRGRPAIYDDKNNLVTPAIPANPEIKDEPYILAWHQTSNLLEEFNNLSKITPFDYAERHGWVNNKIGHYLDFAHPMMGRRKPNLRFVPGENIIDAPKVYHQGDLYASEILVLGAGEGKTKIHAFANQSRRGRLRRVSILNQPSVGREPTARALAQNEIKYRTGLPNVSDFTMIDHPNAPIGSFGVGDTIFVQSGSDWYDGADTWVRIASITYTMGEDEKISIVAVKEDDDDE